MSVREGSPRPTTAYKYYEHPTVARFPWPEPAYKPGVVDSDGIDQKHFTTCMERIITAAEKAIQSVPEGRPKTALFFGAGPCRDIPLVELSDLFDSVTLVELFPSATKAAVEEQLSPDKQSKFRIVKADVTGITTNLLHNLKARSDESIDYRVFTVRANKLFKDTAEAPLPGVEFGDNYTLVSSQLLLSQLTHLPYSTFDKMLRHHGGPTLNAYPWKNPLRQNTLKLQTVVEAEHIKTLRKAVAPDGIVLFGDTYVAGGEPIINAAVVDSEIAHAFDPLDYKEWQWNYEDGTVFDVRSQILQPR